MSLLATKEYGSIIESLRKQLASDRILVPDQAEFAARQASYGSRNATILKPQCIVQPQTSEEVSLIVKVLTASNTPFAVRSGGHTHWSGANNIGENGVTIDLGRMDWVRINTPKTSHEQDSVDIGPGNRWSRVYNELASHDLVVAGGREGNVGVAGLILGGGMAFFTAQHGLACDNIEQFEVVLGNGEIVRAGRHGDYADLFRALKGGGNNFGIVCNFRMRTLPAREVWAGITIYDQSITSDASEALVEFTDNVWNDRDSNLLCFFTYLGESDDPQRGFDRLHTFLQTDVAKTPDFKNVVVLTAFIQIAGVAQAPAYKRWLDLPSITTTCKPTTIPQIAIDYSQPTEYYNTWFTATFRNDVRIVRKAGELHSQMVDTLKEVIPDGDFVTQCLFQPFPQLFGEHGEAAGGNMLGIERQRGNGLVFLANAMVRTPELHQMAGGLVEDWVCAVKEFAATVDGNMAWIYLNYADGRQDPLGSYGTENVAFMKTVAQKYDPNAVFQTLCPGGFKLSNVK